MLDPPMYEEYDAWLAVGIEFKKLGLDMNKGGNAEALHNTIVRWGEELATVRAQQPISIRANALVEKRALAEG